MRFKIFALVVSQFGAASMTYAEDTAFKLFRDICLEASEFTSNEILAAAQKHDPSIEFTPEISLSDPLADQLYELKFSNSDKTILIAMPEGGYDCEVTTTGVPIDPASAEKFSQSLPHVGTPQEPQIYDLGESIILRFFPFLSGEQLISYSVSYDVAQKKAKFTKLTRAKN